MSVLERSKLVLLWSFEKSWWSTREAGSVWEDSDDGWLFGGCFLVEMTSFSDDGDSGTKLQIKKTKPMRLQGPSLALGCLRAIPVTTTAGAKQWVATEPRGKRGLPRSSHAAPRPAWRCHGLPVDPQNTPLARPTQERVRTKTVAVFSNVSLAAGCRKHSKTLLSARRALSCAWF